MSTVTITRRAVLASGGAAAALAATTGLPETLSSDQDLVRSVLNREIMREYEQHCELLSIVPPEDVTIEHWRGLAERINLFMNRLSAEGVIEDGRAWLDEQVNPPEQLQSGHLYVDYEFRMPEKERGSA